MRKQQEQAKAARRVEITAPTPRDREPPSSAVATVRELQRAAGNGAVAQVLGPRRLSRAPESPRIVEDEEGEFELPPLTLADFMPGPARTGGRDRRRRPRRDRPPVAPADDAGTEAARAEAERVAAENEARERAEAAEKARAEAEEKARAEAEEKARIEAEERARIEAAERARVEAEEQARIAAEQLAAKLEQQRLAQEALKASLAAIVVELFATVEAQVGAALWALLSATEQQAAATLMGQYVDGAYAKKASIETRLKKRKTKPSAAELPALVLADIRLTGDTAAKAEGQRLRKVAEARAAEQAQAAALAVVPTRDELLSLVEIPKNERFAILYRAIHHGLVTFKHSDTYRTKPEQDAKKGQQHAPFSREYSVKILGTVPANPKTYVWADWLVHIHHRSSEKGRDRIIEYFHIKTKADKFKKVPQTMNPGLEKAVGPAASNVIDAGVDSKLPVPTGK